MCASVGFADTLVTPPPTASLSLRHHCYSGIISECAPMKQVFALIDKVAKTNSTILILGESGTGKELIANAIHQRSGRGGRLVPVNCGAIPEDILESELFGHEKGAFTGAVNSRMGRFQAADGGTIFLDEIGEMSAKLQVKLLRVLQEKKIEPVGSNRSVSLDVRVVAATHRDLKEEVKKGKFREDLFYRLQVVPIDLPALRARGTDVLLLAEFFMNKFCERMGKPPIVISAEAGAQLLSYSWPGNVRELENLVERLAIVVDEDDLQVEHLPTHISNTPRILSSAGSLPQLGELPEEGVNFNELVGEYETQLIKMALEKAKGNKQAAARLLSLNRTTLLEKIKKRKIEYQASDESSLPLDDDLDPMHH